MFLSWSIKSTLNSFKFIKTLKYKKTTIEQTYSLQYIRILVSTTKFSTSLRDALQRHSQNIRHNQPNFSISILKIAIRREVRICVFFIIFQYLNINFTDNFFY